MLTFHSSIVYRISRSNWVLPLVILLSLLAILATLPAWANKWDSDVPISELLVAVAAEGGPHPVELMRYDYARKSGRALVIPPEKLIIRGGDGFVSNFSVQGELDGGVVIETVFSGDDYIFTSRYILRDGKLFPVMYSDFGFGYGLLGFIAWIAVSIFWCIFFAILRFLVRPGKFK